MQIVDRCMVNIDNKKCVISTRPRKNDTYTQVPRHSGQGCIHPRSGIQKDSNLSFCFWIPAEYAGMTD